MALFLLLAIGALMGLTSNLVKLAGQQGWQPLAFLLWSLLGGGLTLLVLVRLRGERTGITRLLGDLSQAGIRFRDLSTTQSSLEDIFVSLVHRK